MISCCHKSLKYKKKCQRSDKKIFKLPRKFTKKQCRHIKGFSMRSSCAPYKYCNKSRKTQKQFLYNPNNPDKSFDVYIDKNPKDTISIKYKTLEDVKNTINKLENLYKKNKYNHKRIWQVGMIMYVRLKVLKNKKPQEFKLSQKYFHFLGNRTKIKNDFERKKLKFKF